MGILSVHTLSANYWLRLAGIWENFRNIIKYLYLLKINMYKIMYTNSVSLSFVTF